MKVVKIIVIGFFAMMLFSKFIMRNAIEVNEPEGTKHRGSYLFNAVTGGSNQ